MTTEIGREPADDETMLTTPEAAAFLGLTGKTLEQWRWRGCGPEYHKQGGAVRYLKGTLRRWRDGTSRTHTGGGSRPEGVR